MHNAAVMFLVLAITTIAHAGGDDGRTAIDRWLYSSGSDEAVRERAALAALDADPALAKDGPLFASVLADSGVEGTLGSRAKKLAEAMIKRGANVDGNYRDGEPLIVHFAMFAQTEPMKLLLAHGAKPDAADGDKRTALHWIGTSPSTEDNPAAQRMLAAAKLMIAAKASIDARDVHGKTALHLAAFDGNKALVELYLGAKANIDAVDDHGYSVLGACRLRVEPGKNGETFSNDTEKAATKRVIDLLVAKGAKDVRPK